MKKYSLEFGNKEIILNYACQSNPQHSIRRKR